MGAWSVGGVFGSDASDLVSTNPNPRFEWNQLLNPMISVLINDHLYSPPQYSNVLFTVQTHKGDLSLVDGILCFHLWWFGKKSGKSQGEMTWQATMSFSSTPHALGKPSPRKCRKEAMDIFRTGGRGQPRFIAFGVFFLISQKPKVCQLVFSFCWPGWCSTKKWKL